MHSVFLLCSLLSYLLVCGTLAGPIVYEDAAEDDVAVVGSYIREVRQLAPLKVAAEVEDLMSASNAPKSRDNKKRVKNVSGKSDEGGYYRTYGSDAEGEKGYLKETYGKGDQGYKTLDTFHKQDGDEYEFETQTSYGKDLVDDNSEKRKEKKDHDHEGAGTMVDTDYAGGGDGEYSHYTGSDDGGDHYSSHYTEKQPESTSYDHNEHYSSGGGDEGSYEMHSSYSSDDKGEDDDEGDHY
ncbi:spore wall protein 2-like [Odontomachus brunneus]|uniref:spore wall protein 2-like n=1 Tax=Odontomachus brunneus TaxID=486640 RepID=UPI0013F21E41|nr:spore wall protein 2-like [Odontomachus brunneus]